MSPSWFRGRMSPFFRQERWCYSALSGSILAKRNGIDAAPFSQTAAITIILAQFVAIFAAAQRGTPGVEFLLTAHLIFLVALLALEWYRGTFAFAVIAVLPTALAVSFWSSQHSAPRFWPQLLLFSVPIYLVFILYPLLLGRRAGQLYRSLPRRGSSQHSLLLRSKAGHYPCRMGAGDRDSARSPGVASVLGVDATPEDRACRRATPGTAGAGRRRGTCLCHGGNSAAAREGVDHDRLGARRRSARLALPQNPAQRASLFRRADYLRPCLSGWH